ncbi:hypothetical protein PoB_002889700 [Plakobranchus ocellatus]|uniref:Uncharacterized protein n=1 Tax=Plakobranchus ocellatus TaxID=259542 RepID=A0AAV4A554_9GAST|nr:hypothetical protein PoB_002889700 [Plakobranchus ocellatus]
MEIMDFRFSEDPLNKPQESTKQTVYGPVYDVTLLELATVPNWGAPPSERYDHLPRPPQATPQGTQTTCLSCCRERYGVKSLNPMGVADTYCHQPCVDQMVRRGFCLNHSKTL